jgi:tryptophan synthase alpha chain
VTGERDEIAGGAKELVARIRAVTTLPVAVGFGISRPEHVQEVGQWADAAVVGSGLVNVIAGAAESPDLTARVASYVRWLKGEEDRG